MNKLSKFYLQYGFYVKLTIVHLASALVLLSLGLLLYLQAAIVWEKYASLEVELPKVQEELAKQEKENSLGLHDFRLALQDKEIQQIYIKPLCKKLDN